MKEVIQKARVLIEALPYIQKFRDEITVIKLGGSAIEDEAHERGILADVTFMECVGMYPVIVHGGGKEISRMMKKKGIEPEFRQGVRVTCQKTIEVVRDVMEHIINPRIVAILEEMGARAEGISGEEVFGVRRKEGVDSRTGRKIDWGYVGEHESIDVRPVKKVLARRAIPVLTPLGRDKGGNLYNMNADTAASALAGAVKARKLALLSDVPGLLQDKNDPETLIETLSAGEVEKLVKAGIIAGGMLPKVRGALDALRAGVQKAHMIDGRMAHSLLLEIFTDKGVGTEMIKDD